MSLQMKNKPLHEYLEENAKKHPEKVAIYFYGNSITYDALYIYIERTAAYLRENGVKKGDTVAIFMQNSPQFIIAYFAVQKIGAIVAPCNPMFREWELAYQLNDLKAKVIFVAENLLPILVNVKNDTKIEEVIVVEYEKMISPEQETIFPEKREPFEMKDSQYMMLNTIIEDDGWHFENKKEIDMKNDVALIMYTSGTTGSPKGAMLTYKNSEFKTNCLIETFSFNEKDVYLSAMPIFHIAGMVVGMLSPLAVGASIVLLTRFDTELYLRSIEKYGVTVLYTTPPMNVELMKETMIHNTNFSTVRINLATSFGIQITEELSNKWKQYSGIPLFEWAYGMSEAHTGNSLMDPSDIKYGTHGKPTFDTEIKIVDPNDYTKELNQGEEGEIILKSPSVFKGYWNRQEATRECLKDGWFLSGDIGKYDEDGFLVFLGRVKEMIKCSGYSVYPEEVELMLIKHPDVEAAAVIGIPDEKRGESVKAFVVLADNANNISEDDIIQWAKAKMSAYKYPRKVEFVSTLPKTSTGKVLRRKLKK